MKKFLKITAIILGCFIAVATALLITYYVLTADAVLNKGKLYSVEQNIAIYDDNGEEIADAYLNNKRASVKLSDLQQHTINAFIASDRKLTAAHRPSIYSFRGQIFL